MAWPPHSTQNVISETPQYKIELLSPTPITRYSSPALPKSLALITVLHIFLLIFFNNILSFLFTLLTHFLPNLFLVCYIFSVVIQNGFLFIMFCNWELLFYKKAIDFVILILSFANLLNSLIVGYSFLNECLEIFSCDIISPCNTIALLKQKCLFFFSNCIDQNTVNACASFHAVFTLEQHCHKTSCIDGNVPYFLLFNIVANSCMQQLST